MSPTWPRPERYSSRCERREHHDRYLTGCPSLVLGIPRVRLRDSGPEPVSLRCRRDPGADATLLGADLDNRACVVQEVERPQRRAVRTAVRRDHDEIGAFPEERQRRRAWLSRPAAGRRQQQHRHPCDPTQEATTAQPVDREVRLAQRLDLRAATTRPGLARSTLACHNLQYRRRRKPGPVQASACTEGRTQRSPPGRRSRFLQYRLKPDEADGAT